MKSTKDFLRISIEVFKIYFQIAKGLTIGVIVTSTIMSLQSLINAYVLSVLLDKLITAVSLKQTNISELFPIIFLFGLINLFILVITNLYDYFFTLLTSQDSYKLRIKQMDFMVGLGISQLEDPELTNKSTRYTESYSNLSNHLSTLITLLSSTVSIFISGAILFKFKPIVMILYFVLFVFKYINNSRFRTQIWRLIRENTENRRNAWQSAAYLTDPSSVKEMLISGGIKFLRAKFFNYQEWYYKQYRKIRTRWAAFEFTHAVFDISLLIVGVYFILEMGVTGAITVGAIAFYLNTLRGFSEQIDNLSYRIGRAVEVSIRVQDSLVMFDEYTPEIDGRKKLSNSTRPSLITVENLTFSYPNSNSPVLRNINLTVHPGEKIAIVGENGAGKTTLIKVINRIYRPQKGRVLLDNFDIQDIRIKSWYQKIGVLFQDYNTYPHLNVEENVAIGKNAIVSINRNKVVESLTKAGVYPDIEKYPNLLKQILSEKYKGGIRPSGGQWQKIAIARFFYRNAPILILDEPTASIDAISEAQIFGNIYKFMKGKTVIIISHRFSTVRNADRILVLDKGKIIEDGSHEELLKLNGKYAHSFKLQAKGYS